MNPPAAFIPSVASSALPDVICLSHLRWNFVYQRPQHLMTRCAAERRVFFVEEPEYAPGVRPHLRIERSGRVTVATPQCATGTTPREALIIQRELLNQLMARESINRYVLWYYTPMALAFTDHLSPVSIVYDCMDELSAFKGASPALKQYDVELVRRATLVLTGGHSLYEARRHTHQNIHPFPSSVDVAHFSAARQPQADPDDQASIPHPRLGFFGVIDERMDLALLEGLADARPDWHWVLLGPVVKIDADALPVRPNLHYLGSKAYRELPAYIAGWDVALMPFAKNEATRFISPTKTPEYLAAGKPVVSTSVRDVVRPYGQAGLVHIADDVRAFVQACEAAMADDHVDRNRRADVFLRQTSWDGTWRQIRTLLDHSVVTNHPVSTLAAGEAAV